MLAALATRRNRIRTLAFVVLGGALLTAASLVGVSDHPPGIALAYLAATALVLAFIHPWRSPRPFLHLIWITIATFFVSVPLHNFLEVGADRLGHQVVLQGVANALGVWFFLIAVIVCPPALLLGLIGAFAMFARDRSRGA